MLLDAPLLPLGLIFLSTSIGRSASGAAPHTAFTTSNYTACRAHSAGQLAASWRRSLLLRHRRADAGHARQQRRVEHRRSARAQGGLAEAVHQAQHHGEEAERARLQ